MGIELKRHIDKTDRDRGDTGILLFYKFLHERNYTGIRTFGAGTVISTIGLLSERKLRINKPGEHTDVKLLEHIMAAAAGIREQKNLPNTWQEHLVAVLSIIGFSPKEAAQGIQDVIQKPEPYTLEFLQKEFDKRYGKRSVQLYKE